MTNFLDIPVGNHLDPRIRLFLYNMICLEDSTDQDIEDYYNYESADDSHHKKLMRETIEACKTFKAKYLLMRQNLPPPEEILFVLEPVPGKLQNKIRVKTIDPSP